MAALEPSLQAITKPLDTLGAALTKFNASVLQHLGSTMEDMAEQVKNAKLVFIHVFEDLLVDARSRVLTPLMAVLTGKIPDNYQKELTQPDPNVANAQYSRPEFTKLTDMILAVTLSVDNLMLDYKDELTTMGLSEESKRIFSELARFNGKYHES